jgi:type II secretory pathway pseudopilin PulG
MGIFKKRAANTKGMTLIEVIASFAIVAIVAIIVVSALLTSGNAKMRGDAFTMADEQLSEVIAGGAAADTTTPSALSVVVEDPSGSLKTITIPGKVYTYYDEEYDGSFRIIGQ